MDAEDKNSRRGFSAQEGLTAAGLTAVDSYWEDLARGLAENTISRRQALKWAGVGILGAALSSVGLPDTAEALTKKQRRRCRRKGGTPLERGDCHCGFNCGQQITQCHGNPNCLCFETTANRGFCGTNFACDAVNTCATSADCLEGHKCVTDTCCGEPMCAPPCPS
jgi:hypothetical protein